MKKRWIAAIMIATMTMATTACGSSASTEQTSSIAEPITEDVVADSAEEASEEEEEEIVEEDTSDELEEVEDGYYRSELTNLPISEDLKDQRPIAVMVDNELTAYPHYGIADADVVYELMNSTANGRITRLMCLYKDWGAIEQVGSVRSTRPTNILLASEWNAVLVHDGGPYYNDQYFAKAWSAHFSGGFSRVNNGKASEFTEYVMTGDLDKKFSASSYSTEYDEYRPEDETHFTFSNKKNLVLSDFTDVIAATDIKLPFEHTSSELKYNEETQEYEYYAYGDRHEDAETGDVLSFKNVILQDCDFNQLDEHGYLIYNCIDPGHLGYYITNGEAQIIYWTKTGETEPTRYFNTDNEEIEINTGKTYISLIPEDSWEKVTLE